MRPSGFSADDAARVEDVAGFATWEATFDTEAGSTDEEGTKNSADIEKNFNVSNGSIRLMCPLLQS